MQIPENLEILVTPGSAAKLAKSDPRVATIRESTPVALLRSAAGKLIPLYYESLVGRVIAKGR